MATEVERMFVVLEARQTALEKGFAKAIQSTDRTAKKMEDRLAKSAQEVDKRFAALGASITSQFSGFANRLGPVGTALQSLGTGGKVAAAGLGAAAVAATALLKAAQSSIKYVAAINDSAQQTGVGVEALQALRYGLEQGGVEAGETDAALQKLNQTIGDAASGAEGAQAAFAAVGVSIRDANGNIRPTEAILADIADAFARISDPARKAAIAADLFGRSGGAKMVAAISGGSAELRRFADEAQRAGAIISEDTVKKAAEFDDELTRLSTTLKAQLAEALISVGPLLIDIQRQIGETLPPLVRVAADVLAFAARNFNVLAIAAGGFIAVKVATSITAIIVAFREMGRALVSAGAGLAKLKLLLATLGGPATLAITALTAGLIFLATRTTAAERATEAHQVALDNWTSSTNLAKVGADELAASIKTMTDAQREASRVDLLQKQRDALTDMAAQASNIATILRSQFDVSKVIGDVGSDLSGGLGEGIFGAYGMPEGDQEFADNVKAATDAGYQYLRNFADLSEEEAARINTALRGIFDPILDGAPEGADAAGQVTTQLLALATTSDAAKAVVEQLLNALAATAAAGEKSAQDFEAYGAALAVLAGTATETQIAILDGVAGPLGDATTAAETAAEAINRLGVAMHGIDASVAQKLAAVTAQMSALAEGGMEGLKRFQDAQRSALDTESNALALYSEAAGGAKVSADEFYALLERGDAVALAAWQASVKLTSTTRDLATAAGIASGDIKTLEQAVASYRATMAQTIFAQQAAGAAFRQDVDALRSQAEAYRTGEAAVASFNRETAVAAAYESKFAELGASGLPPQAVAAAAKEYADAVGDLIDAQAALANAPTDSGGGGGGRTDEQEAFNQALQQAKSLYESTLTPLEAYLAAQQQILALKPALIELLGSEAAANEVVQRGLVAAADAYRNASETTIELTDAQKEAAEWGEQAGQIITSGLKDVATGAKTAEEAILDMVSAMVEAIAQALILKPLQDAITGVATSLFGGASGAPAGTIKVPGIKNAKGNAFSAGRVMPFAAGGVVSRPTLFPMANGAGLMGEAGPEAILPLARGANGKLGVQGGGGGGSITTVYNDYRSPDDPRPETQTRRDRNGNIEMQITLRKAVNAHLSSGGADAPMGRFGVRPRARR